MIFYEKIDDKGTYFENEEGTIYQSYYEGVQWAIFQTKLASGEYEVRPYKDSPLETADKAKAEEFFEAKERQWRDSELRKSDLELLREVEKQFPSLESKRNALRDYPQSADFKTGKRPAL